MNKRIFEDSIRHSCRDRNVPSFLQIKEESKSRQPAINFGKREKGQFKQITVSDSNGIVKMKRRIKYWIKNTPRISIIMDKDSALTCKVESPSRSLFQQVKFMTDKVKLQKIQQAILALFNIVDLYGYFYCDQEMLRISEQGSPVVWLHTNFCCSETQFPLKFSIVSQFIFVKKLKSTFAKFLSFPKYLNIQSKEQLLAFVEEERRKMNLFFNKITYFTTTKLSQKDVPKNQIERLVIPQFSSQKLISSVYTRIPQTFTPRKQQKLYNGSLDKYSTTNAKSQKNKSQKDCFTKRHKGKTVTFDNTNISTADSHPKTTNSNKARSHNSVRNKVGFADEVREESGENTMRDQFSCKEDSFDHNRNDKKKIRKQSADNKSANTWLKNDQRFPEKTFQNSTFSTRITFCSAKGQLDGCQKELIKSKKKEVSSYICGIPHLYRLNKEKEKETKQKVNAMKQSGMKIAEEDSFENEVQNLFESQCLKNQQKSQTKMRESQLVKEFENLFHEENYSSHQSSFMNEFQSVLG